MTRFDCPSCGKKLKLPDEYAGKLAKCPKCGIAIAPEVADDVPFTMPDPTHIVAPQNVGSLPFQELAEIDEQNRSSSVPWRESEPWFFSFISFYAYLQLAIGIIGFFGVVVVILREMFVAGQAGDDRPAVIGSLILIYLTLAFLGLVFASAMILLVLDMARSFRALRGIAVNTKAIVR